LHGLAPILKSESFPTKFGYSGGPPKYLRAVPQCCSSLGLGTLRSFVSAQFDGHAEFAEANLPQHWDRSFTAGVVAL
jgi:hypothetical protein